MNTPEKNENTVLTPEQVAQFEQDGFLLVEDLFSPEELDGFAPKVDEAVRARTSDDVRRMADKNLYEQTFVQCMRLWETDVGVRPFTFHPRLCAAAAALLKSSRIRLWHDQALYKEPGGRETDAHLDFPFWPVDRTDLVSVWIPFADVRKGGGRMSYVKGSHRAGILDFVDIGQLHGGVPGNFLEDPRVASLPLVPVDVSRGSVVFHHACTIHAADRNNTNQVRRVFTVAYHDDDCRRRGMEPYFALDRDNIEDGERIVGPGHPVAWPRDNGDLPDPPDLMGPKTGFRFDDSVAEQ